MGDLDGWMQPFTRFSQRKLSSSFCSAGDRGNRREQGSSVPGERSMAWSHTFHGGSSSKASLEKMSLKSWYWAGTMSSRGRLTSAFCCDGVSVALMWCSTHSGGMNAVQITSPGSVLSSSSIPLFDCPCHSGGNCDMEKLWYAT